MKNSHKIGIALSGGGARGIAHIGVLQALKEHNIEVEAISGTSAGSIVAALYAAGKEPKEILEFAADNTSLFKMYSFGIPKIGFTSLNYLKDKLAELLEEDSFEHLKIPCYIAITNLQMGEVEIVHTGPLFDVVAASSSIPIVFKPIEINDYLYVDGGLLMNLPAEPLYAICDKVIGVNVMPFAKTSSDKITNVIDIATRVFDLSIVANTANQALLCDVLIEPMKICHFTTYNFTKYEELYQVGYDATIAVIDDIRSGLESNQADLPPKA
ncbi:MAG: patatin-like phospholipase family protein [Saprospiraceae bacterium]